MTSVQKLAKVIDHSILHPTMTDYDLERECLVLEYGYRLKIKLSCLIIHVLRRFIV